ncbi:MAG TPA: anti-sigma factor antagonist [Symbiobacteriaceae bacterium]|jgi:stage II sporulation protein AA (anti-sigma F factor antagonist)|nr:anti-sigma factor antagonist [Symbiobacteriaceae bacterium]
MPLEYLTVGASLVTRLTGELDLVAAAEFRRLADDLLDRRKVRHLVVNLERVTFLDSSFLGALLGRYKRLRMEGGRMVLVGTPPTVRPTLEAAGIYAILREFRSESDALSGD